MSDPNSMGMMMGPGNGPSGPGMVSLLVFFYPVEIVDY